MGKKPWLSIKKVDVLEDKSRGLQGTDNVMGWLKLSVEVMFEGQPFYQDGEFDLEVFEKELAQNKFKIEDDLESNKILQEKLNNLNSVDS
ncbi:MAG: hypothetical protein KGZ74_00625 [Chitinophagaceae bacterium]|nr:hypothetical protein [Chitinophagaceae bacterium]